MNHLSTLEYCVRTLALAAASIGLISGVGLPAGKSPTRVTASQAHSLTDSNLIASTNRFRNHRDSFQTPVNTINVVSLAAKDIVYDPQTAKLYASVPSTGGPRANSITPIDPLTGALGTSVVVGSEPGKLAISDDGQYIYVALDIDGAVRRFDVASQTAGLQFSVGMSRIPPRQLYVDDIEVMPGNPGTVAISRLAKNVSPNHFGVAIYDNGVQRVDNTEDLAFTPVIEFSNSPGVLYGLGDNKLSRMPVASCGINPHSFVAGSILSGTDFKYDNGIDYFSGGAVYNAETGVQLGTVTAPGLVFNSPVEPDSKSGRVFFLSGNAFHPWTIRAYDIQTLIPTGELEIPGVSGTPTNLIRWGTNGLAFLTTGNQLFLIQTDLVPASPTPPVPAPTPNPPMYSVIGRVGEFNGPRLSGATVTLSGPQPTITTQTDANGMYAFSDIPPCGLHTITPAKQYFIVSPSNQSFTPGRGFFFGNGQHMLNFFFSPQSRTIDFAQSNLTVDESVGEITITVVRTGDPSGPAQVDYEISNGTALQSRDFIFTAGTLRFDSGETTRTFKLLISDDAYVEPNETALLILRNPVGTSNTDLHFANLIITDNDINAPTTNPIDESRFFIRQQYNDFLNRTGDPGGVDFWTARIEECNALGGDVARCINQRRVDVSAAFFIELEFQRTGYFIYRMHKAAFNTLPQYNVFMADRPRIVEGPGLEASKIAFADDYVTRPNFLARYPLSLSAAAFVDALNMNTGGALSQAERDALVAGLNAVPATETRASVLRKIAEDADFQRTEFDSAFVLMQYFGYLGRNPDLGGYQFWREILRNKPPDDPSRFRAMICAFLTSREYQQRFSPVLTRSDSLCANVN